MCKHVKVYSLAPRAEIPCIIIPRKFILFDANLGICQSGRRPEFFRFWTPKTIDCPLEINRKDAQNEKNPACGGLSFEDISIYSETVVNDIR